MKLNRSVKALVATASLTILTLGASGAAQADDSNVYWSIGVSSPGVRVGVASAPPMIYQQPVYVQQYPVYVQPRPVIYVQPQPVYGYGQSVYVRPAPVYMPQSGWAPPGRGWERGHDRGHGHGRYEQARFDRGHSGHSGRREHRD